MKIRLPYLTKNISTSCVSIALGLFFMLLFSKTAAAQTVPTFGCQMRPGYRICSSGGCTTAPASCYPTNLQSACPDDPANNKCYAVENQQTCQQFGPSNCASAGPFQCVEVPCDPQPTPSFECRWYPVNGSPACVADISPSVCQDDEANGICYSNDHMQCSNLNQLQCTNAASRACVRVACDASIQPTTTPGPGTGTATPPTTTPPTSTPPPGTTPDYSQPYSSGLRWPPIPTPPGYYAPDFPHPDPKEHLGTPGEIERAIPDPYKSCSSTADTEFHSLRPYQASPCSMQEADIALMCANTITLEGPYEYSPSDCNCTCSPCSCGGGCTCHCDCSKTVTLHAYVDVLDAELPIMGNTEDKIINSQDQPLPEGIDHFAKVNEYVSWYLSGVNQRAEYGTPESDNPAAINYVVDFSGPIKKLLSLDSMSRERNQQIDRAGQGGDTEFDEGGRHDQIVACQSEPGVAAACYTDSGQKLRISNWSSDKAPIYSDYDSYREYVAAVAEWKSDRENDLFQFIPLTSTEDRLGFLYMPEGAYSVVVTGGSASNISVTTLPAELYYPHLEESRENADLLQRTYLSKDFITEDNNGDGINDIDTTKIKHVVPPQPSQCDLTRVRTNPGDTLNPTELNVYATFTVSTSCTIPGVEQCDCDTDPETGEEDCTCSCTPGGSTCPGGTVTVTIDLGNKVPLVDENFTRLVASPYSPVQKVFPKIGSNMPLQGIYDMPGYSLVNFYAEAAPDSGVQPVNLTNVENPGGFPLPPKLFYPHIASIHQYFLNCIQTAVRPQGYGPYCEKGQLNDEDSTLESEEGDPWGTSGPHEPRNNPVPTPTPDPNVSPPPGITPIPPRPDGGSGCVPLNYTLDYHPGATVAQNTAVPTYQQYRSLPNLDCVSEEDYNRVVAAARAAGYNPNFILAIWAEESWAGCYGGVAQMGCTSISYDLGSQLNCILGLYGGLYSSSTYDPCRAGANPTFEEFMLYFSEGSCRSVTDHNYLFCTNKNFPNNFYLRYQQIMNTFGPPQTPPPQVPN